MNTVLDVISLEQLRKLREIGFVIVHQQPTDRMLRASYRKDEYSYRGSEKIYHRMVGESIKIQNEQIEK